MTQYDMVRNHLNCFGSITPKEAEEAYGIMRLAAVVFTLKERGMKIRTEMQSGKNRFGKIVPWAKYVLEEEK